MINDIKTVKRDLRRKMLLERSSLTPDQIKAGDLSGAILVERLIRFKFPRIIAAYWSVNNEFSTRSLIQRFQEHGTIIALPVINSQDELEFYTMNDPRDLEVGKYNIPIPPAKPSTRIEPKHLDIMIVPGVAFDQSGRRLGMGKGYYDRYLKKIHPNTLTVGVAYDFQLIGEVPTETDDQNVQWLWTPRGTLLT